MKNHLILIVFLIALMIIGCKKEESFDYDCYKGDIYYTQNNVTSGFRINYYKNNLIVKTDCSPNYIWYYFYDIKGNLIKFVSGSGDYCINEFNSKNRCIKSEQYIADTLYSITYQSYSDTLLTKEIFTNKKGDTLNMVSYYYNSGNILDSIISNNGKIYHNYSTNSHSVIKYLSSNKLYYKSNTIFENGLITRFEEFYYSEKEELRLSHIETKEYDNNKNMVRMITDHSDLLNGTGYYTDYRFLYDSMGREVKIQNFDKNGMLLSYSEFFYDGYRLIKIQHYNGDGTKSGYNLVVNNCKS